VKIIAVTSKPNAYNKRYLVEAEANELAKVAGFDYASENKVDMSIGATVEVSIAWNIIGRHRGAARNLAEAAKSLRALAELCEQQDPILVMPEPESGGK